MTVYLHTSLPSFGPVHHADCYTTRTFIVRSEGLFLLFACGTVWTVTIVQLLLYKNAVLVEYSLDYSFQLSFQLIRNCWTVLGASVFDRVDIYIPPNSKFGLYTLMDREFTVMLVVFSDPFGALASAWFWQAIDWGTCDEWHWTHVAGNV